MKCFFLASSSEQHISPSDATGEHERHEEEMATEEQGTGREQPTRII